MGDGEARGDTVAELGEVGLVAELTKLFPTGPGLLLGPGDDAAEIAIQGGRVIVTTDMLVEGRHFRRNWSPAYDVGRKAAAQNLVDVAAMGAAPSALLVALALPADLPVQWVVDLAEGLRDESQPIGVSVAGGDVVRGDAVVVSVTALGAVDGPGPLTRAGARTGDVVAVCGRLGWAAAGYAVLSRGFRSPRVVVEAHRRPEPPYDAGPEAARLGAGALIDVSDGLLTDLGHIAAASGVGIDVDSAALEVGEPLVAVGAALNVEPLMFVLTGGEDHALVATFPPEAELPEGWRVIGRVLPDGVPGAVTVDGEAYEGASALYDHFA